MEIDFDFTRLRFDVIHAMYKTTMEFLAIDVF